jgi:Holliday junction resolvasome RuvABC endonuclease subunit
MVGQQLILGIDPGLASMGVALVRTGGPGRSRVLAVATLSTGPGEPAGLRLSTLALGLREFCRQACPGTTPPDALGVEDQRGVFLGMSRSGETNASALDVQASMGVAVATVAFWPVAPPVLLVSPRTVKRAVGASGTAGKAEVLRALAAVCDLPERRLTEHEADAVAVAVAAAPRIRLATLREAGAG